MKKEEKGSYERVWRKRRGTGGSLAVVVVDE